MPRVQEIGQAGPGFFRQINNMQEIPQVYDPEAIQREALQAPRIDPIMTAANVGMGLPAWDPMKLFGAILKDIAFQHVFSSVVEGMKNTPASEFPSPPKGYQEGYYPPSKYAAPRSLVPYRKTDILRGSRWRGSAGTEKFNTTGEEAPPGITFTSKGEPISPKSYKEDLPDYVRINENWAGKDFLNDLAPYGKEGPPNPRELLWHAIGLSPEDTYPSIARDIQAEGMTKGWFSERPNPHFGSIRLGAKPEDLPPMKAGPRSLMVDPAVELRPNWTGGDYGRGTIKTVSGHDVNLAIHPSKFTVIDSEGNLLGRLAEQRAGEKATTSLSEQLFKQILEGAE